MSNPTIFLIGDADAVAAPERLALEQAGYALVLVSHAPDLDAALQQRRPDILVVDLELAGRETGVRTRVVDVSNRLDVPVILMSTLPTEVVAGRAHGAAGCVTIPVTATRLLGIVSRLPVRKPQIEAPPRDKRHGSRFVLKPAIGASFGSAAVEICNLSDGGALVRHNDALRPSAQGRLVLMCPALPTVAIRATVVWSRLEPTNDGTRTLRYASGLRLEENGVVTTTLEKLSAAGLARDPKLRRNSSARLSTPQLADLDRMLALRRARERFAADPAEAQRWLARARAIAAAKPMKELDGMPVPLRNEAIALWEFTGRRLPLPLIARVLSEPAKTQSSQGLTTKTAS